MSAELFLDTNVLVYTFDRRDRKKRETATRLVERSLAEGSGVISSQVVQELLHVALQRFEKPFSVPEAEVYLREVLQPLCSVFASVELYRRALSIRDRWRYHFYDSLILAAALEAGCRFLYTEDLQAGQQIETLTIVNPFSG